MYVLMCLSAFVWILCVSEPGRKLAQMSRRKRRVHGAQNERCLSNPELMFLMIYEDFYVMLANTLHFLQCIF